MKSYQHIAIIQTTFDNITEIIATYRKGSIT